MLETFTCVEMCTSCPMLRAYRIAAMSEAMMAEMPASLARDMIMRIVAMSESYITVLTVR